MYVCVYVCVCVYIYFSHEEGKLFSHEKEGSSPACHNIVGS